MIRLLLLPLLFLCFAPPSRTYAQESNRIDTLPAVTARPYLLLKSIGSIGQHLGKLEQNNDGLAFLFEKPSNDGLAFPFEKPAVAPNRSKGDYFDAIDAGMMLDELERRWNW